MSPLQSAYPEHLVKNMSPHYSLMLHYFFPLITFVTNQNYGVFVLFCFPLHCFVLFETLYRTIVPWKQGPHLHGFPGHLIANTTGILRMLNNFFFINWKPKTGSSIHTSHYCFISNSLLVILVYHIGIGKHEETDLTNKCSCKFF